MTENKISDPSLRKYLFDELHKALYLQRRLEQQGQ